MNELDVYGKIYDMTEHYMSELEVQIPYSKAVFLTSIAHKANEVDVNRWIHFEGEDFINAAYLQLLKRFPTKQDLIYWERQSDYKEKLIVTIVNSMEFIRLRIRVLNMPYQIDIRNNKLKRKLYGDTAEWLQKQWYFKLYISCPSGIKRIAKKVINIL